MPHPLLVLGMHRGGTSSVAGVLGLLGGVPPKTLMAADAGNERGYFESMPLYHLHDELLTSAGSVWHDWRAFNPSWYTAPNFATFKQQARDLFKSEFGDSQLSILKDPRICRFTPFWLDVLGEMGAEPRAIIPVRSPLEVAQSLIRRNGFPITKGLLMWLRHVLDAEAATRSVPRAIFSWNHFLADWRHVAERISGGTGISWPRLSDRSMREVDEFLSTDLHHHRVDEKVLTQHPDVHEWTRRAYEALLILAEQPESNSARAELDDIRTAFERACGLFGRVALDYEIALEEQQSAAGALRADRDHWLAEHQKIEAALSQIGAEKDAAAAAFAQQVEEAYTAQYTLAELTRQRDEIALALDVTRVEKDGALASLAQRTADAHALQGTLAELTWHRDEIAGALAGSRAENAEIAAMLSQRVEEVGAAHNALTELARQRDEIAAALDATRAEKDEAHAALAQRTADGHAMQDMIAELTRHKDETATAIQAKSAENAAIAAALSQRDEEIGATQKALADLAEHKTRIAAALDATRAEKHTIKAELAAHMADSTALLAQKDASDRSLREKEQLAADLHVRLIDSEAESAYLKRVSTLRTFLGLGEGPRRIARRLARSALFDSQWYASHYPEILEEGIDPAEHYVRYGFCRGYFPHPLFDSRYYLAQNEDVRHAGINPLLHYLNSGYREGRKPNAYFDGPWYLNAYADIAALGHEPLHHYATVGFREGRDPSALFKTAFYLETYPDIAASGMNPLAHYIHYGCHEGRLPMPPQGHEFPAQ
jgi:hypothetical protein